MEETKFTFNANPMDPILTITKEGMLKWAIDAEELIPEHPDNTMRVLLGTIWKMDQELQSRKWFNAFDSEPQKSGYYLVIQKIYDQRKRWVRFFWSDDQEIQPKGWFDAKEDQYGKITSWAYLMEFPSED